MSYCEFAEAEAAIACTWSQVADGDTSQVVVPDGCVDLIWLAGRELVVAGPDTGPHVAELSAGSRSVGVRVRPGAAGALLGLPASEVRDQRVPAGQVVPQWSGLADAVAEAMGNTAGTATGNTDAARALLATAVRRRNVGVDPLVGRAACLLTRGDRRIAHVAAELGVTERHLHRRCTHAIGYGPKTLARVVRLHRLTRARGSLAERAVAAGYASQAHMGDDVRALTGQTPVRFLEDRGMPLA